MNLLTTAPIKHLNLIMFYFVKKYPEKVASTAPPRSKKWVNIDTKLQEFINAYNNN